ncbi:putative pgap1-like protein [Golovinomyces cichoracearum]|uniref:Putative pgap1-like protein n=1 Tax=Golovinomyces cichoracearum TaxID=62708 RepID=A0A420IUP6_9PEZI|nr:putative pgap1-like protein [Golovinomyces cichoracearum]
MKKTLLLSFIHGFKGDDSTFGSFPEYLRAIVSHALPNINVRVIVYPKYDTRGDLGECVKEYKEWLLEKVIDLEVENKSSSPIVDPSVRVILIGHSMGGILAADTVLAITTDLAIDSTNHPTDLKPAAFNTLTFPYVQGVLAFDTPYLGLSPGVVAHINIPSSTLTQLSGLTRTLWGYKTAEPKAGTRENNQTQIIAASSTEVSKSNNWPKIAAIAGTSVALAAGGVAAAYLNREAITNSWSWVGSHLEFVGCLMNVERLRKRVSTMATLNTELGVGFGNLYTCLGKRAIKNNSVKRTFCNIPKSQNTVYWHEIVNHDAVDEISAHTAMFQPRENPGYYIMSQKAKSLIVQWTMDEWYSSSVDESFG